VRSVLEKVQKFLRGLEHWFVHEGRPVWLTAFFLLLPIPVLLLFGVDEQRVRVTGMVAQFVGLSAVVVGIERTRKFFGLASLADFLRRWISHFPKFDPGVSSGAASLPLDMRWATARGTTAFTPGSSSPDDRLDALEKYVSHLGESLDQIHERIDSEAKERRKASDAEQRARHKMDSELMERIEKSHTDGLLVSLWGVFYLFWGALITSIPVELAGWLN
jgi:hypothetical protein